MVNKVGIIKHIENIDNKYLIISLKLDENIEYKSGQYIIVLFSERLRRSYSICSFNENEMILTLAIKLDNGEGSNFLRKIKIGDKLDFLGPFGNFFYRDTNNATVLIATGIGITPIHAIIKYFDKCNNTDFQLFWGVKYEKDFIFDFTYLGDRYIPVVSDDFSNFYNKGYITDFLLDNLKDFDKSDFYICGDPRIVRSIKSYIENKFFINKERIYTEKF
jgi:Na+-transporting NADH:ubiquinone oxidoreductase subunit F